jgi:hypothetical protein
MTRLPLIARGDDMIELTPGLDSTIRRITVLTEELGAVNLAQGFSDEIL